MSKETKKDAGFSNSGEPHDSFDLINMYGTYNIQPTADHGNEYPAIAQGLSKAEQQERERAREAWKREQAEKPESGGKLEADPTENYDIEVHPKRQKTP